MYKITFLGASSALSSDFQTNSFHSNIFLEADSGKKILIDCGSDIPHSLKCMGYAVKDIDSVYISHLHNDHAGGLEWLGFKTYFSVLPRPRLYIHSSMIQDLWNMLKPSMGKLENKEANLSTYFDVIRADYYQTHTEGCEGAFNWEEMTFTLIKNKHVTNYTGDMFTYGLLIYPQGRQKEENTIYISSDTQQIHHAIFTVSNLIFHDADITNRTDVHVHYNDLKNIGPKAKNKMFLYHYSDCELPDAESHGFAGFVRTGDVFVIGKN